MLQIGQHSPSGISGKKPGRHLTWGHSVLEQSVEKKRGLHEHFNTYM